MHLVQLGVEFLFRYESDVIFKDFGARLCSAEFCDDAIGWTADPITARLLQKTGSKLPVRAKKPVFQKPAYNKLKNDYRLKPGKIISLFNL
jgi:hypothetical protein